MRYTLTRRVRRSLVAALAAVSIGAGGTTAMAAPLPTTCPRGLTSPVTGVVSQAHPVILVHGWTGTAMQPTRKALEQSMGEGWQFFLFDYHAASTQWASQPEIAGCLAAYLSKVSKAHSDAHGDGRVYLVAHSMGGLAVRFAADPGYQVIVDNVPKNIPNLASHVGGLVTLDTPHSGSPWAGSGPYASVLELKSGFSDASVPAGVARARICLAVQQHGQMPTGCDAPPYLPAGVRVDQVGGSVTIRRSFFGVHAYDIPLGGDSIVTQDSEHGYLRSAAGGGNASVGQSVRMVTAACNLDAGSLIAKAAGLDSVVGAIAQMVGDSFALDAVLSRTASPALLETLIQANLYASCSHTGIVTNPKAIAATADALRADVAAIDRAAAARKAEQTRLATRPLTVTSVRVPPISLPNYDTSGSYPQVSGGGLDLTSVNAALRDEVLRDQAQYVQLERKYYGTTLDNDPYPGTYKLSFSPTLMSASTSVVSTMYPSLELFPGGNDGQGWMYLTVPVPSGKAVELVDLLTSKSRGLQAIAVYVEEHLLATRDSCARDSHGGFDPTVENYRNFALTVRGLDIGLGQGQIGDAACGAIRVTVPWSVAGPQLNATGQRLRNGLR